jgi:hypothetical protein
MFALQKWRPDRTVSASPLGPEELLEVSRATYGPTGTGVGDGDGVGGGVVTPGDPPVAGPVVV